MLVITFPFWRFWPFLHVFICQVFSSFYSQSVLSPFTLLMKHAHAHKHIHVSSYWWHLFHGCLTKSSPTLYAHIHMLLYIYMYHLLMYITAFLLKDGQKLDLWCACFSAYCSISYLKIIKNDWIGYPSIQLNFHCRMRTFLFGLPKFSF